MSDISLSAKIYFDVPFARKEEASEIGLLWDQGAGKWFANTETMAKQARGKFERLKKPRIDRGPGSVAASKLSRVASEVSIGGFAPASAPMNAFPNSGK